MSSLISYQLKMELRRMLEIQWSSSDLRGKVSLFEKKTTKIEQPKMINCNVFCFLDKNMLESRIQMDTVYQKQQVRISILNDSKRRWW